MSRPRGTVLLQVNRVQVLACTPFPIQSPSLRPLLPLYSIMYQIKVKHSKIELIVRNKVAITRNKVTFLSLNLYDIVVIKINQFVIVK